MQKQGIKKTVKTNKKTRYYKRKENGKLGGYTSSSYISYIREVLIANINYYHYYGNTHSARNNN